MRNQRGQFIKGHNNPGSVATQFKPGEHWRDPKPYWDRDWLYEEYVIKQRSASEIASDFDCHPNNINHFLHKHGIKTRTTSEARAVKHWGSSGKENGMFGVRRENHPNWQGGITPERQSFYSSIEWGEAVKAVWERDGATCQRCKKTYAGKQRSFHIHHILSFYENKGDRASLDNLVLLCLQCHRWVHSKKNINKDFIEEVVPNGDVSKRERSEDSSP